MHIHKPKAAHGVREFLSEIGVIVVGIAIALCGEQTVEWLHWRAVVAETREALNRELAGDLGVVQFRIEEGPCETRRLSELSTAFRLHAAGTAAPVKAPLGQPQFPRIHTSVWETALQGQGAAHMPLEMKLRYAGLYDSLGWIRDRMAEEAEAWTRLSQFDDRDLMSEADWSALRQWKSRAQAVGRKVDANLDPYAVGGRTVRPTLDQAAVLGVVAKPVRLSPRSEAARDAFCRPML